MDVEQLLLKQGWKKGEGLRPGSIKKPLLVKHRKNNKGLGFNPQASEGWWERVFDGHLKSLGVSSGSKVEFTVDEEQRRRDTSPLYACFRSGGVLEGSIKDEGKAKRSKHKAEKSTESSSHRKLKGAKKTNEPTARKEKKHSKKRKRDQAEGGN